MNRRHFLAAGAAAGLTAIAGRDAEAAWGWPIPDWETVAPDSEGVTTTGLDALKSYLTERGTRAALVIRNGRIVGEWFWEDAKPETRFPVYSCTKSFAATAVLFLAADGKLDLEQPAADFIPEWKTGPRSAVKIRHLLSMTSGMSKNEPTLYASGDKIAFAVNQQLRYDPGAVWDYNNVGCSAVSPVIAKAAGMEMSAYLKQKLYDPLGMKEYSHEEPAGHTLPYSGLQINARDLARFGLFYERLGVWKTKIVLSAPLLGAAVSSSQHINPGYGYLWWVNTASQWPAMPTDAFAARGAYGNELLVIPTKKLMVVRLVGTKENAGVDMNRMGQLALAACSR